MSESVVETNGIAVSVEIPEPDTVESPDSDTVIVVPAIEGDSGDNEILVEHEHRITELENVIRAMSEHEIVQDAEIEAVAEEVTEDKEAEIEVAEELREEETAVIPEVEKVENIEEPDKSPHRIPFTHRKLSELFNR